MCRLIVAVEAPVRGGYLLIRHALVEQLRHVQTLSHRLQFGYGAYILKERIAFFLVPQAEHGVEKDIRVLVPEFSFMCVLLSPYTSVYR